MKRPSRFTLVFITVMIAYLLGYVLYTTANPKFPFEPDMPTNATAMLQLENPEFYSRDPVYKDGVVTKLFWSSNYVYMKLFQGLHNLTQRNISATMALLQLIPSFTLFLSFFWLLSAFPLDRWLCLMFSVGLSIWVILLRWEGIASTYYFACIPVFIRLLWQFLAEPSLHNRPVVLWHVVVIGMVIGSSPFLINSVNGLAFNAFTLCLVTVQFLAMRMKWQSYAALLVGLLPFLALATLVGAGGANALQDDGATQYLYNLTPLNSLYVYIYSSFIVSGSVQIFGADNSWLFYFPLFALVVVSSLWVRYTPYPSRIAKISFLSLSAFLWLWTLGNTGFLLYMYFLSRFWRRRETAIDYVLITGLNVAVFIGPILLWIAIGVWQLVQWHSLVFIMGQMFRFHHLIFALSGVTLVFMIQHLTERVGNASMRYFIQFMFILGFAIQASPVPAPVLSLPFLALLSMALFFMRLSASSKFYFTQPLFSVKRGRRKLKLLVMTSMASVAMLLLSFYITWGSGPDSPLSPNSTNPLTFRQQLYNWKFNLQTDYMSMTEWLRLNTPVDSLIHFEYANVDQDGFFRFLSQRAMFYTWMDIYVGQYSPGLAASNRQLYKDWASTPWILFFGPHIARYDINYVVIHTKDLPPLPILDTEKWYVPRLVYSNENYKIYHIEKILTSDLISMLVSNYSDR